MSVGNGALPSVEVVEPSLLDAPPPLPDALVLLDELPPAVVELVPLLLPPALVVLDDEPSLTVTVVAVASVSLFAEAPLPDEPQPLATNSVNPTRL